MNERTVWLDDTPGEIRGVICGPRGYEHILTQAEDEDPAQRLGAVSIGRVVSVEPGLKGVFLEVGESKRAFLPLRGGVRVNVGDKLEVEVVSEQREQKGVTLALRGGGEGATRLLSPGPSVAEWLARLAPGIEPIRGKAAIEAGWHAVADAESPAPPGPGAPVLTVERTRAMITVDFDLRLIPGKGVGARERAQANHQGLREAARQIRLRRWGGLVALDLVGVGHNGKAIEEGAREAFGPDRDIVYGPVNRFGVLQLAMPWRFTPLEEHLYQHPGFHAFWPHQAAIEVTRRLNFELLSDTTRARVTARCPKRVAELAGPLVARLGPRAHLKADDALAISQHVIEAE